MQTENKNTTPLNETKPDKSSSNEKKKGGFLGKFVIALLIILLCCAVLMGIWRISRGSMSYEDWDDVLSNITYNGYNDHGRIMWRGDDDAYFFEENTYDEDQRQAIDDEYREKMEELDVLGAFGDISPNDYQDRMDEIDDWYQMENDIMDEQSVSAIEEEPSVAEGVFEQEQLVDSITSSADGIDHIKINTVRSKVIFENSDDNQVAITISAKNKGRAELRYYLKQKGNDIEFSEKKSRGQFIVRVSIPKKTFDSIQLNSVSSDIVVDQLNCKKLTVNTVSGKVDVKGDAETLKMNSVSGNLTADITPAKTMKVNSVSGSVSIKQNATVPKSDISTVSGNIEVIYFNDASFRYNIKTAKPFSEMFGNGTGTIGSGEGSVKINSASGDIDFLINEDLKNQKSIDKNRAKVDPAVATP